MAKCIICGMGIDIKKETICVKNNNCYCHYSCYEKLTNKGIYLFSGSYYSYYKKGMK